MISYIDRLKSFAINIILVSLLAGAGYYILHDRFNPDSDQTTTEHHSEELTDKPEQLQKMTALWVKTVDQIPSSSPNNFVSIYADGSHKCRIAFRDSKKDGDEEWFYPDGKQWIVGANTKGRKNGVWKWFLPDGQQIGEGIFINGKAMNGTFVEMIPIDDSVTIENRVEGKIDGNRYTFHSNGKLRCLTTYRKGRLDGEEICHYITGVKKYQRSWKNGTLEGKQTWWNQTGQVRAKGTCRANKPWTGTFFLNANIRSSYRKGIRHGKWVWYNSSGKVKATGVYKDGKPWAGKFLAGYGPSGNPQYLYYKEGEVFSEPRKVEDDVF